MITSKLTTKAQTTVPQPVRTALGLREGDELVYQIEAGRVVITKRQAVSVDDPFATFEEWDSEADRAAYASFSPGDVVRVPFPYTNRDTTQFRPALVVSDGTLGSGLLLWTVMITSDQNRHWPGDVPITDLTAAGLPASSVVRTLKIATIDSAMATPVGRVDDVVLNTVQQHLLAHLALTPRT